MALPMIFIAIITRSFSTFLLVDVFATVGTQSLLGIIILAGITSISDTFFVSALFTTPTLFYSVPHDFGLAMRARPEFGASCTAGTELAVHFHLRVVL
jgi:hypothetical protein